MIGGKDIYAVLTALVPLYVAMILAYGSVRWWKIFTPEQCSGINRFVAVFAVPLLSFNLVYANDIYAMNFHFIVADSLQKVVILVALFLWQLFAKNASLEWTITLFSLSTLPNTLVMGIPMLSAMYGGFSGDLMVQVVVLQGIVWYTLLLIMFEYRGAKLLISEQFPDTAGSITSVRVESDVVSLSGPEPLEADAEIEEDGKLHVVVRQSSRASSMVSSFSKSHRGDFGSNLSAVEIYSVQSSTPRASSLNQRDLYKSTAASPGHGYTNSFNMGSDVCSRQSSKGVSNFDEEVMKMKKEKDGRSFRGELLNNVPSNQTATAAGGGEGGQNKELPMFVWSSNDANIVNSVNRVFSTGASHHDDEGNESKKLGTYTSGGGGGSRKQQMPPASVVMRLIIVMVWRKLIRNPNTYASIIGLVWSLISFRWHIEMPKIVSRSIEIMSNCGLGMAMFSLGLFMALQPKLIACGKAAAAFSMGVRFLVGPAVMAATTAAVGIRGKLLHVAVVQAALPQGIVPFVFSKEYSVHPDILSTAVIFGMVLALPITIIYYVLLGL